MANMTLHSNDWQCKNISSISNITIIKEPLTHEWGRNKTQMIWCKSAWKHKSFKLDKDDKNQLRRREVTLTNWATSTSRCRTKHGKSKRIGFHKQQMWNSMYQKKSSQSSSHLFSDMFCYTLFEKHIRLHDWKCKDKSNLIWRNRKNVQRSSSDKHSNAWNKAMTKNSINHT